MAESQWFYMRDGKRVGPIGLSAMREMLARGALPPETSVWTVGMNQWVAAADVRTLSGNVAAQAHASQAPHAPAPHAHAPHAPAPHAHAPHEPAAHAPAPYAAAPAYSSAHAPVDAVAPAPASAPAVTAHDPSSGDTAAAPVEAAAIGYYGAVAGVPPRALANLEGHARPTGDTGDWPLDDARVASFAEAVTVRKKVTGAAQLYRALLFLSALTAGVLAVVFAFVLIDPPRGGGGGAGMDAITMGITLTFLVGLCALYYFAWRATTRAHRWAPLTMLIIFALGMVLNLFSIAGGLSGRGDPAALVGGLVGVALSFLFAFVSLQSLLAIPRYLAQPAWCQELIVKAGL
jgi:hypothetical protein